MQGLKIRKTIDAVDQLRGLPSGSDVKRGEIPSLVDLGLNPIATMNQVWYGFMLLSINYLD